MKHEIKMPSKKRKRGGNKPSIHPRNKYAENPPDFSKLASLYPSFSSFVFYSRDGRPRIDWTDFNATRELTKVLLHHDHALNWWIPDGQLCPTVPNRSNYIHWVEDLLASDIIENNNVDGDKVRGFDLGTGANCIYPLLGASLLGWSFVGSDITDVALEWAEKNVKDNPQISDLIEIRRARVDSVADSVGVLDCTYDRVEYNEEAEADFGVPSKTDVKEVDSFPRPCSEDKVGEETDAGPSMPSCEHGNFDEGYHEPPVLVGVVKEGETFDFCMCNPPFFESMEEAGLNPKTSCGGTTAEMVCPGGEKAFIGRIIKDSVVLKQSFRWYTSMVGRKTNLKFLISKLWEVGVTIVKTTEFVQGQTSRWGLAWSFMPATKKIVSSHLSEKTDLSFMLQGLHRQSNAFSVLGSTEQFFCLFGASCTSNSSSFTVDVSLTNDHSSMILKTDVEKLDEESSCILLSSSASHSQNPANFSFRISVFQQIPGTLLVKGSLQQSASSQSGTFASMFKQLELFLKHKFGKEKTHQR